MEHPLRPEHWEALLRRLGPDREVAGARYEALRRRLVHVFAYRGCDHPEELADETLDRSGRKLQEMGSGFVGEDPSRFVFGVAWNVARESFRRPSTVPLPDAWERPGPPAPEAEEDEAELEKACLDRCLGGLSSADRCLVLGYHEEEKSARIRRRSALARELGLSPNGLRLRIHRITGRLRDCVVRCVASGGRTGAGAVPPGAPPAME
jgi:DNA-directed RNA polymerase specialized sigma24 family protein